MNRTDRLYALREELRRAGHAGRTAEQLAITFGVSERTVKRDVACLQQGGFPVSARFGRQGGYVVDDAGTLPPVNITTAEAAALAAAIRAHRGQPFDGHGRAALDKILAVMDEQARRRASRLADRIWISEGPARDRGSDVRGALEQALQERLVLALGYRGRDEQISLRRVDPQLLAHCDGQWYLVGHCRLRRAVRWFGLDRIEHATVTPERARDLPRTELGEPPNRRPVAAAH